MWNVKCENTWHVTNATNEFASTLTTNICLLLAI